MGLKLPSSVKDKKYIRMPPEGNVIEDDKEWEKCGMWILPVPNNDLSWLDNAWIDLQELLNNGCLLMLKASTAAFRESGVIFCYTRPGQEEARKTAVAIREIIREYKYVMFHKSIGSKGHQRRFGNKHVSQYLHTFLGGFYSRDANDRWQLVGEPLIVQKSNRKKPVFLKSMITQAHTPLPSSEEKIDFDRNSDIDGVFPNANRRKLQDKREIRKPYFPKKGFWHFKCSLEMEKDGLTEADRVWLTVKRLYDRESFVKITSVSRFEIKITDIFCYVSDYSDAPHLINDCKYILKNTHFSSLSNFYTLPSWNTFSLKYVLTPEEELYEEAKKLTENDMTIMRFLSEEELLKKI